ncbi:MAG: histidinol dehydrogenase [Solirubrobacteraceae bacterium]
MERVQQEDDPTLASVVAEVVAQVRDTGDHALVRYTRDFDGVELGLDELRVGQAEIESAGRALEPSVRDAVELAVESIRRHHSRQSQARDWINEVRPGVITGERFNPIASAGLYVPRGKGSFPSVMAMLTVPARLAGVSKIVVCTPPGSDGHVEPASLYAAALSGVTDIFRIGGAQAIAALAYGTETVPKVEKIVGPGNRYVTYAKRLLYGVVDPGPPAGPSEAIVLADGDADARTVAVELLVEAEHGPDSAALLVTDSIDLANAVEELLPELVDELPETRRGYCETVLSGFGGIVVARDLDDAVRFTNEWAPEHLHVLTRDPMAVLYRLEHAGEVLLGPYASISYGNYVVGVNAILPTGGFARSYSCVGVDDFTKRSSFASVSDEGARAIGEAAATLADYEGFPSHARAARHALERARGSSGLPATQ